jgi:hypothetical protein
MPNTNEIVDRYIATWNETDTARRTELVARTFTQAARYADPLATSDGHAAIAGLIAAVQAQFPGHVFKRRGIADAHATYLRFSWSLGLPNQKPVAGGTDFATVDTEGRLVSVTGFLDPV